MRKALDQLKDQIRGRYEDAEFSEAEGDDPAGIYLYVILDVAEEDLARFYEDVQFLDLLDEIQGGRNLPIYVFTTWPPARARVESARQHNLQKPVATA